MKLQFIQNDTTGKFKLTMKFEYDPKAEAISGPLNIIVESIESDNKPLPAKTTSKNTRLTGTPKHLPTELDDTRIKFGKFNGQRFGDIPASYLKWLYESIKKTGVTSKNETLHNYILNSWPKIQEELRVEGLSSGEDDKDYDGPY